MLSYHFFQSVSTYSAKLTIDIFSLTVAPREVRLHLVSISIVLVHTGEVVVERRHGEAEVGEALLVAHTLTEEDHRTAEVEVELEGLVSRDRVRTPGSHRTLGLWHPAAGLITAVLLPLLTGNNWSLTCILCKLSVNVSVIY